MTRDDLRGDKAEAEVIRQLEAVGGTPEEYDCPICAADYGPSDSYVWHWPDEDCRAIREPISVK